MAQEQQQHQDTFTQANNSISIPNLTQSPILTAAQDTRSIVAHATMGRMKPHRGAQVAPDAPVRRPVYRPTCTHLTMRRVYGHEQCQVCWRYPSLGWLYACEQDCEKPQAATIPAIKVTDDGAAEPYDTLRKELEQIGLSDSIIKNVEQGGYTPDQLEKLKAQKLHLKASIALLEAAEGGSESDAGPSNTDGAHQSVLNKKHQSQDDPHQYDDLKFCKFRACHTCRPYFKDRIYTSFESVLSQEFIPFDTNDLPVSDASIMRNIGLRIPPLPTPFQPAPFYTEDMAAITPVIEQDQASEDLSVVTTQSSTDTTTHERLGRRRFYKLGRPSSMSLRRSFTKVSWQQSLKRTFQGLFKYKAGPLKISDDASLATGRESSSEGSNITLPLPRTGTHRDMESQPSDFDLGPLKRINSARRSIIAKELGHENEAEQKRDVKSKTSALPKLTKAIDGITVSGTGTATPSPTNAASGRSTDYSGSSRSSVYTTVSVPLTEAGSEVEVDGGVALTEEAVETHTPDMRVEDVEL